MLIALLVRLVERQRFYARLSRIFAPNQLRMNGRRRWE